jgi:CHAD domain-containing protein
MSYRIDARAPLTAEIRHIIREEMSQALDKLEATGGDPDEAVHECRQHFKRVRASLALIRSGAREFAEKENIRLRDAARQLASSRDAGAMIETVERLAASYPKEAVVLGAAREALLADRHRILSAGLPEASAEAVAACRAGIDRLDALSLPDEPEPAAEILAKGAGRTLRRARDALREAESTGAAENFHDLRKATKAHAMHLALLRDFWPPPRKKRRAAVMKLGVSLGELQDIHSLRQRIRDRAPPWHSFADADRVDLLSARTEKKLRKSCLRQASKLFADKPGRFAKKIARSAKRQLRAA